MKRFVPFLVVIAGSLLVSALLPAPRRTQNLDTVEVARATGIRVLGATRGYVVTALWLRAGEAYDRGELYETLATYQLIRELQPRNPAVYSYLSWNEAYNISAQFPERERREEWVTRGLRTLHDGQDRLPRDASLRLDEYHFLLNRCAEYPMAVLRVESDRLEDAPAWKLVTDDALALYDGLDPAERSSLDEFLAETGLALNLFETADAFSNLDEPEQERLLDPGFTPETPRERELAEAFPDYERERLAELLALEEGALDVLARAHWCRLHAMVLVLRPALDFGPHSIAVEEGVLAAAVLAWHALPPFVTGAAREDFLADYKEVVAKAFLSGIENAHRVGGVEAAVDFIENTEINFEQHPELLSPELTDRALQEIQE